MSVRPILQLRIFLSLFYFIRGSSIFGSYCYDRGDEACINLGSEEESIGKFLAEDPSFITYRCLGGCSNKTISKRAIKKGTAFSRAISTQRTHRRSVNFVVGADKGSVYTVSVGLAELKYCRNGFNSGAVKIQGEIVFQGGVFDKAGCGGVIFVEKKGVEPDAWGKIEIIVEANKSAAVSTVCFKKARDPSPIPSTPLACSQESCINVGGTIDYTHIHGTMLFDKATQCKSTQFSSTKLQLPSNVKIFKAFLRWSVYGDPRKAFNVQVKDVVGTKNIKSKGYIILNGKKVFSTDPIGVYYTPRFSIYSESALITDLVGSVKSGTYKILEVFLGAPPSMCVRVQHVSWSLVVIYERPDLPNAFVNICGETASLRGSTIRCLHPEFDATNSRIDLVFNGGHKSKTDAITINGKIVGTNALTGRLGNGLDVVQFSIGKFLKNGSKSLNIDTKSSKDVVALTIAMTYQKR